MAECNWDPKKHGGKPCPIHGSGRGSSEEIANRKNRRQELKQNEDSFRDNKYSYSTARKVEDEINDKYRRKSSEKYNIGSNKELAGEERQKMQDLVDAFNEAGIKTELVDGWEDYGAKMAWTAPVINDTWALNPRQWIDYMNGKESIQDIVEDYAEKHNINIDDDDFDDDFEEEFKESEEDDWDIEDEDKEFIKKKIKEQLSDDNKSIGQLRQILRETQINQLSNDEIAEIIREVLR